MDKYIKTGVHCFPKRNFMDAAEAMISGANEILAVGSHSNTSEEYGKTNVSNGSGVGVEEWNKWFARGCYCKPKCAASKKI